jgi:hypothetical protein
MTLLAEGNSYREIAWQLSAKERTIIRQVQELRNRYARTNEQLIAIALTLGWIRIEIEITEGMLRDRVDRCPFRWTPKPKKR